MKGQQRLLYLLPACILVFAFFLFPLAYLSYISFFEWDGCPDSSEKHDCVAFIGTAPSYPFWAFVGTFAESKTKRVEGISGNVFYT